MDTVAENIFLDNFIDKRIRDRMKYELSSRSKRMDAIGRFCHQTEDIIIKSNIYLADKKLMNNEISKILHKLGAQKTCYILSYCSKDDGKTMEIEKALDTCCGFGMPTILICVPDHLIYIECEQEQGPAPKYILFKKFFS